MREKLCGLYSHYWCEQPVRGPGRAKASQIWQTTVLLSVEWLRANTKQNWGFTNIAKVIVRTGALEGGRVRSQDVQQ